MKPDSSLWNEFSYPSIAPLKETVGSHHQTRKRVTSQRSFSTRSGLKAGWKPELRSAPIGETKLRSLTCHTKKSRRKYDELKQFMKKNVKYSWIHMAWFLISPKTCKDAFWPQVSWLTGTKWYSWWLKSCTTWDVWNLINNGMSYL